MANCRDKGKFVRCAGAPTNRRKHRKSRKSWEGCGCPKGSTMVKNRRKGGRGWSCMVRTGKGPRFVGAVCP